MTHREIKKGTVQVDGIKLAFQQTGRGDDILLVHGLGAWSVVWTPLMKLLSSGFRLTALDLPGHGGSGPVPQQYTIRVLSELIASFARGASLVKPVVVGHSFGCLPLVRGVAGLGSRALILLSPVLSGRQELSWVKPLLSGQRGKLFRVRANRRGMRKVFRDLLFNADLIDAAILEELLEPLDMEENRNGLVRTAELIETDWHAVIRDLHSMNRPVLLIRGSEDPLSKEAAPGSMFDVPGIRQVVIDRCGHFPQIEKPDEVAGHIRRFAEEL